MLEFELLKFAENILSHLHLIFFLVGESDSLTPFVLKMNNEAQLKSYWEGVWTLCVIITTDHVLYDHALRRHHSQKKKTCFQDNYVSSVESTRV